MELIRVSANSRSTAVAGAIAGVVREHGRAEVQTIGAGAVNQAVKASAIARGYLLLDGINVALVPSFGEVDIEGAERTTIPLEVTGCAFGEKRLHSWYHRANDNSA